MLDIDFRYRWREHTDREIPNASHHMPLLFVCVILLTECMHFTRDHALMPTSEIHTLLKSLRGCLAKREDIYFSFANILCSANIICFCCCCCRHRPLSLSLPTPPPPPLSLSLCGLNVEGRLPPIYVTEEQTSK